MPPVAIAAASVAAAAIPAIAGAGSDVTVSRRELKLAPEGELERFAGQSQLEQFQAIQGIVSEGPGVEDVTRALEGTRGLAAQLGELSKTGFVPTAGDITGATQLAERLFEPERVRQAQLFERQRTQTERLSARLGRPVNDPILQARLLRAQSEQAAVTGAQQRAFGTQIAFQRPQERLGLQQQQVGILAGLGSQALANRTALLGLGQQLAASERQFRLEAAGKTVTQTGGGGFKGAVEGGLAGFGAFSSAFSMFGGKLNRPDSTGGTGGAGGSPQSPFLLGNF